MNDDTPQHVPLGHDYLPHQQGQHVVGPTCSSGCAQYGNRTEARAAQRKQRKGYALPAPNKRRAARKAQRQNRKAR